MKWKDDFIEHLDNAESISMGLHSWQGSPFEEEPINAKELIADPTYYTPNYLVDAVSTIHVQRPNTLEDRITKIEEQLKLILNANK